MLTRLIKIRKKPQRVTEKALFLPVLLGKPAWFWQHSKCCSATAGGTGTGGLCGIFRPTLPHSPPRRWRTAWALPRRAVCPGFQRASTGGREGEIQQPKSPRKAQSTEPCSPSAKGPGNAAVLQQLCLSHVPAKRVGGFANSVERKRR